MDCRMCKGLELLCCCFENCAYNVHMAFQWDSAKAAINLRKHGIRFADAVAVFEDEKAITLDDDYPSEDRYISVGLDMLGRVIVVVYTWREKDIWIISVRLATKQERKQYESNL